MSLVWQADFYRSPQRDTAGQVLWELLLCDATRSFEYTATCLQSAANSSWVTSQIEFAAGEKFPDAIQVFRPQSLSLIEAAGRNLGIKVEPTRRTLAIKEWLQEKQYPLALDKPPPSPYQKIFGENNGVLLHSPLVNSSMCLRNAQFLFCTYQNFSNQSIWVWRQQYPFPV